MNLPATMAAVSRRQVLVGMQVEAAGLRAGRPGHQPFQALEIVSPVAAQATAA